MVVGSGVLVVVVIVGVVIGSVVGGRVRGWYVVPTVEFLTVCE